MRRARTSGSTPLTAASRQACFSPGQWDDWLLIPEAYPNRRRSDSAVKQILLTMNEKESFIIEDLDDHHVVIKADEEYRVRRQLEAEVRT